MLKRTLCQKLVRGNAEKMVKMMSFQKSIKIIQINQNVKKMKSMMINKIMKSKLMMRKVSQNLSMMPNFGGECKTTRL